MHLPPNGANTPPPGLSSDSSGSGEFSVANFSLPFAGDPSIGVNPRAIELLFLCLLLNAHHTRPAHSARKTSPPTTPPMIAPLSDDLCDPEAADFAAVVGAEEDVAAGVGATKE